MASKNNQPKQVYHDGFVYEEDVNDLFITYRQIDKVEEQNTLSPKWLGKPIPLRMWKEILAFMKQSQDKFKSETLAFLYYDVSKDQPWSYWVPPQETAGMTVKTLPDDPLWKGQRKAFPDIQFGTVHHHCSSSAFQSGTDQADEVDREGLHFTIGKLNDVDNIDVHFRLSIGGYCTDMDAGTYIEMEETPFKKTCRVTDDIKMQVRNELHKIDIATLPDDWEDREFKVQMDNVHERSIPSYTSSNNHYGMQSSLGYGYGFESYEDDNYFKKKEEVQKEEVQEEVELSPQIVAAESLITSIASDYEYEEILELYFEHKEEHALKNDLFTGRLSDDEICFSLCEMLEDDSFRDAHEYKKVDKLLERFLGEESSEQSFDLSKSDLLGGLQTINYEEGIRVQHMDKENVL